MPTANLVTNVDKALHSDATGTLGLGAFDRGGDTPKRSLRGAAGGVYVGPVRPGSASHTVGGGSTDQHDRTQGGGVEDTTGYRKSDTFDGSGGTGGGVGFADGTVTSVTRSTGRTAYIADGVQGGSVPGRPISSGNHVAAGGGYGGGGTFDKRSTDPGPAGHGVTYHARKSSATGYTTQLPGVVTGETVAFSQPVRPTTQTGANPASGVISLDPGAATILRGDLHADDITGGANGNRGIEVFVFARGSDTDTDLPDLVARGHFDSTTQGTVITGLTTGVTYAVYARFVKAASATGLSTGDLPGPFAPRTTVTIA